MLNASCLQFCCSSCICCASAKAVHQHCPLPGSTCGSLQRVAPTYATILSLCPRFPTPRQSNTRTETAGRCYEKNTFPHQLQSVGVKGFVRNIVRIECLFSASTALSLPHRRGCAQHEDAHHHERAFQKINSRKTEHLLLHYCQKLTYITTSLFGCFFS